MDDTNFIDKIIDFKNIFENNPLLIVASSAIVNKVQRERNQKKDNTQIQEQINKIYTIYRYLKDLLKANKDLINLFPEDKLKELYNSCTITSFKDLKYIIQKLNDKGENNYIELKLLISDDKMIIFRSVAHNLQTNKVPGGARFLSLNFSLRFPL